jgi:hypothetical protein
MLFVSANLSDDPFTTEVLSSIYQCIVDMMILVAFVQLIPK